MGLRDRLRDVLDRPTVLKAGDFAPELGAMDATGKHWTLADLRGRPAVVYFYPKDDTPGCTKEACAFRDVALPAQVLGVSMDHADSHRAFAQKFNLGFPLLSDTDGAISRRWGVLGWRGAPRRVTFLLGADRRISHVFDLVKVEGHAEEIRQALAKSP